MPLQRIQIGTYPNDGTGDTLRRSFEKVNENFLEVYNELGEQANVSNTINIAANRNTNVIFRHANSAFNQANAAFFYATQVDDNLGYAYNNSNVAFNFANGTVINTRSAFIHANSAYAFANNLSIQLNDSVNGVKARTNLIYSFANSIYNHTNVAFSRANLVYDFANAVHAKVNSNFTLTNVTFGRANSIYLHTNAAFSRANAAFDYADRIAATKLSNTGGISFAGSLFFPFGSRIGFGTNTPAGTLHIRNNTDNPLVLLESDGTQNMAIRFRRQGTNRWNLFHEFSTDDFVFSTDAIPNVLRVANEGNIGIGIVPQFKLDVNGTSNFRSTANFGNFVTVTIPSAQLGRTGVYSLNPDGYGVVGEATRRVGGVDGSMGVWGKAYDGTGVRGEAVSGFGVRGISTTNAGVRGESQTNSGTVGISNSGTGGWFSSATGSGVYATSSQGNAIVTEAFNAGSGVVSIAKGSGWGVIGDAQNTGVGGYFRSNAGIPLIAATGPANAPVSRFSINNNGDVLAQAGSPLVMKAYMCRAWASFSGVPQPNQYGVNLTIYASGNISSVVYEQDLTGPSQRGGGGMYRVNFTTPMPDNLYSVSMSMQENGDPVYNMRRKAYGNQYLLFCNGSIPNIVTPNYFKIMTMFGNALGGGFVSLIHVAVFR